MSDDETGDGMALTHERCPCGRAAVLQVPHPYPNRVRFVVLFCAVVFVFVGAGAVFALDGSLDEGEEASAAASVAGIVVVVGAVVLYRVVVRAALAVGVSACDAYPGCVEPDPPDEPPQPPRRGATGRGAVRFNAGNVRRITRFMGRDPFPD
ncbi:MAG: hypothetical protein OXB92_01510 [Acidimicrobiaceae bacterium]|nr:hypothetical protein [Acidimicrobiia bacterium]MCY4492517.1 hypothetical protein [Acidimicrobiaceae bacterium]